MERGCLGSEMYSTVYNNSSPVTAASMMKAAVEKDKKAPSLSLSICASSQLPLLNKLIASQT